MPIPLASPRARAATSLLIVAGSVALAACSTSAPPPSASGRLSTSPLFTLAPTMTPSPTPLPTPSFTNPPDPSLLALVPPTLGAVVVDKPPITEYGVTPGDIGQAAYGRIGVRFRSLVIAYVERPRTMSLYAMRVDPPAVHTADLEPYLAPIGEYVGIQGLHPEAWHLAVVAGRSVWTRGEDPATAAGTTIYTWAASRYVFLLIGVVDAVNRQMVAALPGEPPPAPPPTSVPSRSASPAPPVASPSPSAASGG
ncbi:MAG: hypothetical protein ACR2KI_08870 [Candidatus Limnocylindria bacterium]